MTYFMLLLLYAFDAAVFANKNLTEIDLYDGNSYHNVILFVRIAVLLYLFGRIYVLRTRPDKRLPKAQEMGFAWLYIVVTVITLAGYTMNDFYFRYLLRDLVTNLFAVAGIHALVLEHINDANAARNMLRIFRGLLVFHLLGIVILTVVKFDTAFIVDKLFAHPLERRTYEEGRLYFFALAGNEEAYTILLYAMLASIGWKLWVKSIFLLFNVILFMYLGTRTVFFISVLIVCIWPLVIWPHTEARMLVVMIVGFGLVLFWDKLYQLIVTAFDFLPSAGGSIDISMLLQEDTLGWRVMFVWLQIWEELARGVNLVFGISVNGLAELGRAEEEQLTAVHNAFLYFLAVSGVVGLYIYTRGYVIMARAWKARRLLEGAIPTDASLSFAMAALVMGIYALMNNAYSIQGMLSYMFLVAFAISGLPACPYGYATNEGKQESAAGGSNEQN